MSDGDTNARTNPDQNAQGQAEAAEAEANRLPGDTAQNPIPAPESPVAADSGNGPTPEPKATADASAPIAQPEQVAEVVADLAPEGRDMTPSAGQEFAAAAEGEQALPEAEEPIQDLATAPQPVIEGDPWARALYFDDDIEKHPVVRELRRVFPNDVLDIVRFRDETTIHVRPSQLREICYFIRDHDQLAINFLTDLTAVDMLRLRAAPRFDVVVQLYSIPNRVRLRLKAGIDDGETVPSLVPVWNGANWLEREAYDMFGIVFEGHPNLRRMLLADDWDEGHPLRKDYPLRGWKEFPVYNTERTVPRVRTRWTGRGV
ncbi:MAG: NADH-quinone oxidoreductase subunit C [Thermomicrobiales bacterium]